MRNYRLICCILIALFVPLLATCKEKKNKFNLPIEQIFIQTKSDTLTTIQAELAIKEEERNWGYMERKVIPDGTGMLFVFETDRRLSFWMKNTPHPLSIAYIGSDGVIYDILDMMPYSQASVQSSRSVRFALEVPQGYFKKMGVSVGDKVFLKDNKPLTSIR